MSVDSDRPGAGVVWSRVEDGFHVGSKNGEFLGYVDRQRGNGFAAFDLYSRSLGVFPTLVSAMAAVNAAPEQAQIQTPVYYSASRVTEG